MNRFTIGRLAAEAGVSVETVRYYERRGLLARPARPGGTGYREYGVRDLAVMQHIKLGKALGLRLGEMRQLANVLGEGPQFCAAFRETLQRKLEFVRSERKRLKRIEIEINETLAACGARGGGDDCPIQRRLESDRLEAGGI